jgi:hypothetical protein
MLQCKGTASGFVLLFALVCMGVAHPQSDEHSRNNAPTKSSLTGCVDEQHENYVLVDDRQLKPIADLEANGFPTESFAKYLGHKVTVRGTSSPGTKRPLFKVRAIEPVSDVCRPEAPEQQK